MSKKEKGLLVFAAVLVTFALCLLWRPEAGRVLADWVDQTVDGASEYSKYPLENYKLEIMLDGWGFSKIGKWILNMLANMIFSLNNMFSYFVGWVIDQAYQVDFIGEAIDFLSGNIQAIAGVDAGGFRTTGLFPSLAPYLILCAAVYFVWVGIFKRRAVQAAVNLGAFCIIFVLGMGFVAYSGSYLHMVNDFQKEFNEEIVEISSQITLGGSGGDMVDQMRENTFVIMVKNPYLMFNYGTSDVEAIGEERINELLAAPVGSDEREDLVEQEYDDLDNTYMGEEHLAERLGMCLVVLVVNLIVGICILLFSAMLIMAQVMFVLYMSFFPVALVFSLFPNSGGRLKKILGKSLDTILMRPGISLILTVVFSISMLCYQLAGTGNYLWTMFLQGVTFVVAIMKTGEFLGYMKVGSDRGDESSLMRVLAGGVVARTLFKGVKKVATPPPLRKPWNPGGGNAPGTGTSGGRRPSGGGGSGFGMPGGRPLGWRNAGAGMSPGYFPGGNSPGAASSGGNPLGGSSLGMTKPAGYLPGGNSPAGGSSGTGTTGGSPTGGNSSQAGSAGGNSRMPGGRSSKGNGAGTVSGNYSAGGNGSGAGSTGGYSSGGNSSQSGVSGGSGRRPGGYSSRGSGFSPSPSSGGHSAGGSTGSNLTGGKPSGTAKENSSNSSNSPGTGTH